MIVDTIENWQIYRYGKIWERVFEFLRSLSEETPDGEYPLQGEAVFTRIMTYQTRVPEDAVLEAHRNYVDVQVILSGTEAMEWFPAKDLRTQTPYEPAKDVEFFIRPCGAPGRLVVTPGMFAVFFPADAHMPCLHAGASPEQVKKAVVKIQKELLRR